MTTFAQSTLVWTCLGFGLSVITFGFQGTLNLAISLIALICGASATLLYRGFYRADDLMADFETLDFKPSSYGIRTLLENQILRHQQDQARKGGGGSVDTSITGAAKSDAIVNEILELTLRDYVSPWYTRLSNDETFLEALRDSATTIATNLAIRVRNVNWVPFLTTYLVDDFASHIRLYRKATERLEEEQKRKKKRRRKADRRGESNATDDTCPTLNDDDDGELESMFFDLELDMETHYCRDLVSTSAQYEGAYLRDLVDCLLYILLPPSDFASKPFRFLLREYFVTQVLSYAIGRVSEPDYVNHTIVWLLDSVPVSPEEFMDVIESSTSLVELDAISECLATEIAAKRACDTGGEDDLAIKAQLASLMFVKNAVNNKIDALQREKAAETEARSNSEEPAAISTASTFYVPTKNASPEADSQMPAEQIGNVDDDLAQSPLTESINGTESGNNDLESADPDRTHQECTHNNAPDFVELSLAFLLSNNIGLSYFIDYQLSSTDGGQNLIYLYLAAEGFSVSATHHITSAQIGRISGTSDVRDYAGDLESVREAALTLFDQYMGPDAPTPVKLDPTLVAEFQKTIKTTTPSAGWFEAIQDEVFSTLRDRPEYYSAFKRSPDYAKMLAELDLPKPSTSSDSGHTPDPVPPNNPNDIGHSNIRPRVSDASTDGRPRTLGGAGRQATAATGLRLNAQIASIAVSREIVNKAFAVYFITVTAEADCEVVASWNILRRYSDFFDLHNLLTVRFGPSLPPTLTFPGKKSFNNLNREFLERRRSALNAYLATVLDPELIRTIPGIDDFLGAFLMKGAYDKNRALSGQRPHGGGNGGDAFSNVLINPILSGVKSMGNAVVTMPDAVYDGVTRVGDGLGRMTKSVFGGGAAGSTSAGGGNPNGGGPTGTGGGGGPVKSASSSSIFGNLILGSVGSPEHLIPPSTGPEGRVAAGVLESDNPADIIPLRILLLLTDEVFNLRSRNTWFRRRLVNFLQGLLRATFGSSINRKILDFVAWLTHPTQVADYLRAARDYYWPGGRLADWTPTPRSQATRARTRVVAKAKMIAALPDELRLFIGSDTTRHGIGLVFDTLQNPHLNRRLAYVLLERLIVTIFPDSRFDSILKKLHSKSPRCQAMQV